MRTASPGKAFFQHFASRLLKKATGRKENGICGGSGYAHTPTVADSSPAGLAFSASS